MTGYTGFHSHSSLLYSQCAENGPSQKIIRKLLKMDEEMRGPSYKQILKNGRRNFTKNGRRKLLFCFKGKLNVHAKIKYFCFKNERRNMDQATMHFF